MVKSRTKKKGRETAQQKTSGMLRSSSYIPSMHVCFFFLFNFKLTEQGVSKEHKKDIRPQIKEDDEEGKNYMRKFMVSFYAL